MLNDTQGEKEISALPQQLEEKRDLVTYAPVKIAKHWRLFPHSFCLALECIFLACAGALIAQYYEKSSKLYLYLVEVPWTSCFFEALVFISVLKLLKQSVGIRSFVLHAVVRVLLAGVLSSAAIFALREGLGEFRVFSLFLVLLMDVCLASLPVQGRITRRHLLAALLFSLLLSQLYYSLIYGAVLRGLPFKQSTTVWICYSYPVVIGLFKASMQAIDERHFDSGDLLEVISFGIADLPYRFIYFSLDNWSTALMLLGIKYSYKVYGYWVTIFLRRVIAFFSLKVRRRQRKEPGKRFFVVPGNSKVFEVEEFLQEMAMKFFMQEVIDSFDLVTVLAILAATRQAGYGIGHSFSTSDYCKISEQILLEVGLEALFATVTVLIVQRKCPEFRPWKRGAEFLKSHKNHVVLLMGAAYPIVFLLVCVFKSDIAELILDQVNK